MASWRILSALLLVSVASVHGQEEEQHSDTRFVDFVLETPCTTDVNCNCYHLLGPIHYKLDITRVVGGEGALDEDGQLENPQEAIANGILSASAKLTLATCDAGYGGGPLRWRSFADKVTVNGWTVHQKSLVSKESGYYKQDFEVPIGFLRFAGRNKGGQPTPGENEIVITPNLSEFETSDDGVMCGPEVRETYLQPISLEFDAMSPVIMVHGNGSDGSFFDLKGDQSEGGFGFTEPFKQQKIPYDNGINFNPPSNFIDANRDELHGMVPEIAGEFGAHRVHLVAHSKGGLDSRSYLETLSQTANPVGVLP